MLKEQKVVVKWNNANKKHYISNGYNFFKIGEEFEVEVHDLPKYSDYHVDVICDYCGTVYSPIYKNYIKLHKEGKDCCLKCRNKKASETMLTKYGETHYAKTNEFKTRVKETCREEYGVDNPSNVMSFQNKKKITNRIKYGADWYTESKDFENVCISKYGVSNPMQSIEIQEKATKTLIENNNVPISIPEKRLVKMLIDKYGSDSCIPTYQVGRLTLDCLLCIDDIMIDIEYDGEYWHRTRQQYDRRRDEYLKSLGYKILRIISNDKLPTLGQIIEAVEYLHDDSNSFTRIIVNV